MRKLRAADYQRPASIAEAVAILAHHGDRARVLAGGTDLLVAMKRRTTSAHVLVDIKSIPDLACLERVDGHLRIGAAVTIDAIARRPAALGTFALLAQGARAIGHPQIRHRATVAGNLCNASPGSDMSPPLLALDARLVIASPRGERRVDLEDFFTGPFRTDLASDELVVAIDVPVMAARTSGEYAWASKITAVDESLVGVAACLTFVDGGRVSRARVCFGSVAPTPIRARQAEALLEGERLDLPLLHEAARVAALETSPRSRAEYRRELARVLTQRVLTEAAQQAD